MRRWTFLDFAADALPFQSKRGSSSRLDGELAAAAVPHVF